MDPHMTTRILNAALGQILDGGVEALNYPALAKATQISESSMYQLWPTKTDLALAVLEQVSVQADEPNTGSVVQDLIEHYSQNTRDQSRSENLQDPSAILGRLANPVISQRYMETLGKTRRTQGSRIIARGVDRGELPKNVDAASIIDTLAGIHFFRQAVQGRTVSPREVQTLIETLCANPPLLLAPQIPQGKDEQESEI